MGMLTTANSKLQKAAGLHDAIVASFTIPAGLTCPYAGACALGCYAKAGAFLWKAPREKHLRNLEATKDLEFVEEMVDEVMALSRKAERKGQRVFIRIHDAGDFYSQEYFDKWIEIASRVGERSVRVTFYAYTKSLNMVRARFLPLNMTFVFSTGGKLDSTINTETERHTKVFSTEAELVAAGYTNASADDLVAADRNVKKVGLVFHGSRKQAQAWGVQYVKQ
jgi:hypothetical protein